MGNRYSQNTRIKIWGIHIGHGHQRIDYLRCATFDKGNVWTYRRNNRCIARCHHYIFTEFRSIIGRTGRCGSERIPNIHGGGKRNLATKKSICICCQIPQVSFTLAVSISTTILQEDFHTGSSKIGITQWIGSNIAGYSQSRTQYAESLQNRHIHVEICGTCRKISVIWGNSVGRERDTLTQVIVNRIPENCIARRTGGHINAVAIVISDDISFPIDCSANRIISAIDQEPITVIT